MRSKVTNVRWGTLCKTVSGIIVERQHGAVCSLVLVKGVNDAKEMLLLESALSGKGV